MLETRILPKKIIEELINSFKKKETIPTISTTLVKSSLSTKYLFYLVGIILFIIAIIYFISQKEKSKEKSNNKIDNSTVDSDDADDTDEYFDSIKDIENLL